MPTTIAALNGLSRHCDRVDDRRVFAEELQVYEVTGTIVSAKVEDDRDHHIILTDSGQTIITELPDAACVGAVSSPHHAALVQAHTQFLALFPPGRSDLDALSGLRVTVRGVGFFDDSDGKTGGSRSCIELHPIVAISASKRLV